MISICFSSITVVSIIYALFSGNFSEITNAIVDSCSKSVKISLELCGMSCFWCGIMRVFLDFGVLDKLSRFMSPILGRIFPSAWKTGVGKREITAAISANLLGIGNAATPYALAAMKEMDSAQNIHDMATFTVLGTCSASIIPTTLITLRRAAGSAEAYSIIVPIWLCSFVCASLGVILSKVFGFKRGDKNAV